MNNHACVTVYDLNDVSWTEVQSILVNILKAEKATMFKTTEYVMLPMPSSRVSLFARLYYIMKGFLAWFLTKILQLDMELTYWAQDLDYQLWLYYTQRFIVEAEESSKESLFYQEKIYPDWIIVDGNRYLRSARIDHGENGLPMLDQFDFETLFMDDYAYQLVA
jgi:hypothetical protein